MQPKRVREWDETLLKHIEVLRYDVTYDNPAFPDTEDVDGNLEWVQKDICNRQVTSKLVSTYNHAFRKKGSAIALERAIRNYAEQHNEFFNLCFACNGAIKVKTASVPHGTSEKELNEYLDEISNKSRKGSISFINWRGKKDKLERRETQWNPTKASKNVTYVDIRPHYEKRQFVSGNWFYVWVDGSGIDKLVVETITPFYGKTRIHSRVTKKYYALNFNATSEKDIRGKELVGYVPPVTYRLFGKQAKCSCPMANLARAKHTED